MTEHTQHTPGPWRWAGAPIGGTSNGLWLEGEGDWFIARSLARTTEADMALIAAAPDLLRALRFVQEHALALSGSPMFEIVANAIAKAEGKDHD